MYKVFTVYKKMKFRTNFLFFFHHSLNEQDNLFICTDLIKVHIVYFFCKSPCKIFSTILKIILRFFNNNMKQLKHFVIKIN